jgi:hypothetical protein
MWRTGAKCKSWLRPSTGEMAENNTVPVQLLDRLAICPTRLSNWREQYSPYPFLFDRSVNSCIIRCRPLFMSHPLLIFHCLRIRRTQEVWVELLNGTSNHRHKLFSAILHWFQYGTNPCEQQKGNRKIWYVIYFKFWRYSGNDGIWWLTQFFLML